MPSTSAVLAFCWAASRTPESSRRRNRWRRCSSSYVPSNDLVVGGDVVYSQCHMYVGDTTPESRKNWIAALDRLAGLNPAMAVAGHKKPGAPDSPSAIQDTKRYLLDFDRLQQTA